MTLISTDTFEPLDRYVAVLMQQGVPIADADWNEREDIRRFELRTFLRAFAGDGTPHGADAFRIEATGAARDFRIGAGPGPATDALAGAGRALAGGVEALVDQPVMFRQQPLHVARGASAAALAAA